MEFYLPSFLVLIAAAMVVFFVFPKLTPLMLAVLAATALVAALYNHYTLFGSEYQLMTWVDGAKASAPYVLVSVVVIFIIGYLLYLFGQGRTVQMPSLPPMNLPSANSATNPVTRAINNTMVNTGMANRNNNGGRNFYSTNANVNANNSQMENILRSRLNKQV